MIREMKTQVAIEDENGAETVLDVSFEYLPFEAASKDCPETPGDIDNIEAICPVVDRDYYHGEWVEQIDKACWDKVNKVLKDEYDNEQESAMEAAEAKRSFQRERYAEESFSM